MSMSASHCGPISRSRRTTAPGGSSGDVNAVTGAKLSSGRGLRPQDDRGTGRGYLPRASLIDGGTGPTAARLCVHPQAARFVTMTHLGVFDGDAPVWADALAERRPPGPSLDTSCSRTWRAAARLSTAFGSDSTSAAALSSMSKTTPRARSRAAGSSQFSSSAAFKQAGADHHDALAESFSPP